MNEKENPEEEKKELTSEEKFKEPGQKRFTLAHEMGHYFNEKFKNYLPAGKVTN